MSLTVHFILLLFCFTFCYCVFHLFCPFCSAVVALFCFILSPVQFHLLHHYFIMFLWSNGFPLDMNTSEHSVNLTPDKGPLQPRLLVVTDSPNWWTESTIVSSSISTWYHELPVNFTAAYRLSADLGHWWLQIYHMDLTLYHSELHWLHSAPLILFYNIIITISVTLNWCALIFYLVLYIPTFLNNLTFDIVHTVWFIQFHIYFFQFGWLYFCRNIKWEFLTS